jgi:hypothetical protein
MSVELKSARAAGVCGIVLMLASCGSGENTSEVVKPGGGESRPAPDGERDATLVHLARLRESAPSANPQSLDLSTVPEYLVEPLLLASRRNRIKGHDISKVCADLIDEVDGSSEVRWVVYDGKRLRAQVPATASSVFCDDRNVYIQASSADAGSDMVYRFSRDARFLDAMKISMKDLRASDTPGSIVAMSIDEERLIILWSGSAECTAAADPACRAYSVRWAPE